MAFQDYSSVPASNTTIGDDIFIGPNMERAKVRPALQQLAADGRLLYDLVGGISLGSGGAVYAANQAAGEAATTTGQVFYYQDGSDGFYYRVRTGGGSTQIGHFLGVSALGHLTPEQYGAAGDGVTNDTAAFVALTAAITTQGGGSIRFRAGATYMVGGQTFAAGTGHGYSYDGTDLLLFQNLTKPLHIDGNGAKIKYASGLKFGAFNPTTGAALSGAPSVDPDTGANLGYCIFAIDCAGMTIRDLEIDGNQAGAVLGGYYGDTGYQLGAYGIGWQGTPGMASSVHVHHMCLDGFLVQHPGATVASDPKPVTLLNCSGKLNARNNLTWSGGIGLTTINCDFDEAGKGTFGSSPGAGIDIEAESAVCRRGLFINTGARNNSGPGFVADSGDSADCLFMRCEAYGTTAYSVWPNKPRFHFADCKFSGQALANYNATSRGDATFFERCTFTTERFNNIQPYSTGLIDASTNARFRDCSFFAGDSAISLGSSVATVEFADCSFTQTPSVAGATITGIFRGNNHFAMTTGSNDFSGSINYGRITYTGTVLSLPGVGGEGAAETTPIYRQKRLGHNGSAYVIRTEYLWNDSAVAGTTFAVADFVRNGLPTVGGPFGWVNTVAGTPGTQSPVGVVGQTQAATVAALAQTISATPTQAEVQAISTKVDAILTSLKNAKVMA